MVCLMALLLLCTLYCELWMIGALETVLLVGTEENYIKPQESRCCDRDSNTSQKRYKPAFSVACYTELLRVI